MFLVLVGRIFIDIEVLFILFVIYFLILWWVKVKVLEIYIVYDIKEIFMFWLLSL